MRLLLAEPNPTLATLLRDILTEDGFAVTHAPTREAAAELATADQWDVVLADAFETQDGSPDPRDLALFATLAIHAPVLLCTAYMWGLTETPSDLGVRVVLPKPFDLDQLLQTLRAL